MTAPTPKSGKPASELVLRLLSAIVLAAATIAALWAGGWIFAALAAVAAVLLLLVHKTALGLFIQAVGLNPTAARFSGISARALIFWVYGFCGVTAAVAGVIVASKTGRQ